MTLLRLIAEEADEVMERVGLGGWGRDGEGEQNTFFLKTQREDDQLTSQGRRSAGISRWKAAHPQYGLTMTLDAIHRPPRSITHQNL